jgi:uncharacterized protein
VPPSSRYLQDCIEELALDRHKMAFVGGPRQVGKTTLSKTMLRAYPEAEYFTWEDPSLRRRWIVSPPDIVALKQSGALVVFDEIHKAKGWKRGLKGIYDLHGERVKVLVTGSARLNVFRKGSDSLLGRYLLFQLHPFSVGELLRSPKTKPPSSAAFLASLRTTMKLDSRAQDVVERLMRFGGFPEPYVEAKENLANLWRRSRVEKIVREDLRDLSRIPELSRVEMLVALLPERVGGMLSVQSLSQDLEVAHTTVRRWLNYLDELYYCYEVKPYATSIARSIRKEGKLYLWDWSEVESEGARFENLVAGHLLKACDFWTDTGEGTFELRFLRNKEHAEVDFLIVRNRKPWLGVEVKLSDTTPTPHLSTFGKQLPGLPFLQICRRAIPTRHFEHVTVVSAATVLPRLP